MKNRYLVAAFSIFLSISCFAQSDYFINPSFEGDPGKEKIPSGWTVCNARSTPDIQPIDVLLSATEGQTFAGLVMRGPDDPDPKNEDLVTHLLKPLNRDSTYILSIDLAYAPYLREGEIIYDNLPQLRITGGYEECITSQIIVVSKAIDHSEWSRYCFVFTPRTDITYLSFEIFSSQPSASYLVLDNLRLEPFKITGPSYVCKGTSNVIYSLPDMDCVSAINATYTGNGATIRQSTDNLIMDFSTEATNGDLIVRFMNGISADSIVFPVTVDENLPVGGTITGASSVCQGQQLEYYLSDASNTSIYNWSYSGIGAEITSVGTNVTIDFSADATSGTLTLLPENGCGTAPEMSFDITVVPLPARPGLIDGEDQVCPGQTQMYHISGITYANDYKWDYTGSGATFIGSGPDIQVNFSDNSTGGYLTVTGVNACGEGKKSLEFIVFMSELPEPAGIIEGLSEVCPGQTDILYKTSGIRYASDYVWNYTGQGAVISGNSNETVIDFTNEITDGLLTVSGRNACGTGSPSPEFRITAGTVPPAPGAIIGDTEICSEDGAIYTVQPVSNTTSYLWNFDGSGAAVSGNDHTVEIIFNVKETSGNLYVYATNECGASEPSPPLKIFASSCEIFIPNAFSPNNDGMNDRFVIRNLDHTTKLIIFDRNGKIVYENDDYQNDWDGTDLDGRSLPTDTYWYVLSIEGFDKEMKGYLYLKR